MPRTFQLSSEHMRAFSAAQTARFENEMVAYFQKHYPDDARRLGEEGLRKLIRSGVERARSYEMARECDVARFVQFLIALRPDFDTAKDCDWVRAILTDRRLLAPDKLDRIAGAWPAGPQKEPC